MVAAACTAKGTLASGTESCGRRKVSLQTKAGRQWRPCHSIQKDMSGVANSIKATKPKTTSALIFALVTALTILVFLGVQSSPGRKSSADSNQRTLVTVIEPSPVRDMATKTELATFAAGCFWSVELAYQRVPGVVKTAVGYTQGKTENPTYEDVCSGTTGHAEAVLVEYDPSLVSYDTLLEVFWHKHDPTQKGKQGNDWGSQYRSGAYYHTPEQEMKLKASLEAEKAKHTRKIWTEILPATKFYMAEEYHQQYLEKRGRNGRKQSAAKGCTDPIRCYG